MKKIILILIVLAAFLNVNAQTNYYVSNTGDDTGTGLIGDPWKTITEVNTNTFSAGDSVLFKYGGVWRDAALTVTNSGTSGNTIVFGAYGTGDNPIIDGADVITGMTQYSGNVYQKTGITTEPNTMWLDSIVGEVQTSIANCDTAGQWFWDVGTDIFYAFLDTAYGTDLLSGWGFTSGWQAFLGGAITDANSFTTAAVNDGIRLSSSVGATATDYKIRVKGTTTSTDMRVTNAQTVATYITGLTGTFDTTVYITTTGVMLLSFKDYGSGGTTDMDIITVEEVLVDTDAVVEIGQRAILFNAGSEDYITINNLTFQHSNSVSTAAGAVYMNGGSYLTVTNCNFNDNTRNGLGVNYSSNVTVDNNTFLRNGLDGALGHGFLFYEGTTSRHVDVNFTNNVARQNSHNGCVIYTNSNRTIWVSDVTVSGNTFDSNGGAGCYTIRCDSVVVYNNTFDGNGNGGGVGVERYSFASEGCNYIDFYNNTVTDNIYNDAVQFYSDDVESSHNVRIFNNFIDGVGTGDALGLNFSDNLTSNNVQIYYNVFANADLRGIGCYRTGTGVASTITIYNNTFYGNAVADIILPADFPADVKNNILRSNGAATLISANALTTGLTVSNNLYGKTTGTVVTYNSTSYTTTTISGIDAAAQTGDPLFVDAANGDFTLQVGSPAINNGVDVGLTEDILGNPIVGLPDIGAYEYTPVGTFKFMRNIATGKYVTKNGEFVGRTEY